MKVLAFVEGPSESGGPPRDRSEGAVEVLIHRVVGADVEVEFEKVANVDHRGGDVRGGTMLKKAVAAMVIARGRRCDGVVFLVDQDKPKFAGLVTQMDQAQRHPTIDFPRAVGVAILEFEAWLLADEVAIRQGMIEHLAENRPPVPTQPSPEDMPDPKAALEAIVGKNGKRDLYAAIARHLRLDVVATRCPAGFDVFHRRLLAMRPAAR